MPHTIAENLTRLTTARTDIADAIIAKGGTVTAGDGFEEFPADIATIPSGSQSVERDDVNFYDYDGTIVDSYTASEFASLTAMPDNPSHDGLTAQGWNWSLVDAKAYVAKYGELNIGQTYNTDDGALRIYIHLEEGRLSPVLGLCPNGTLTVDWGDGSPTETMTGSSTSTLVYLSHTYTSAGDYVISVLPSAGSEIGLEQRNNACAILSASPTAFLNPRQVYLNSIYKVEIPASVTRIGDSAFGYCRGLELITIPSSITTIGTYTFQNCCSLTSVIIPSSVTSIGNGAFENCYDLESITAPSRVSSIGNGAFYNCYGLESVTISNSITDISTNTFYDCYTLTSVIIPSSVTSISANAFQNCCSLTSVIIPSSVTSISTNAFYNCYSITSVVIPSSVTSIISNTFYDCYALTSVIIPSSVTSIRSSAFQNCYGLGYIKFTATTPPTVQNSSAWSNVPTDCIIYVPAGYLEDYEDATNYPDPDVYTYVEY